MSRLERFAGTESTAREAWFRRMLLYLDIEFRAFASPWLDLTSFDPVFSVTVLLFDDWSDRKFPGV